MASDLTQMYAMPKDSNCETIPCKYCDNEAIVLQKDNIVSYICPVCYSVPRLNKREDD